MISVVSIVRRLGRRSSPQSRPRVLLSNSRGETGSFDYTKYRELQTAANKANLNKVWALEENIAFISEYIMRVLGAPAFGLCHGTRRGAEQAWFRKHLNCKVIGTEISDTAHQFPFTIQWDFHDVKSEWLNQVDFVYSNSLDHSYDPERCLNAWMSCVRPGGLCVLEHSSLHSPEGVTDVDPFGADIQVLPYLILKWANGRYGIRDLLETPKRPDLYEVSYNYFVIIQKHG